MDENDECPLCCEELDISDQQFFPCKCGYQVCMWCWHRIRESESGLCPACRTPYGDDPHEFSAVDMEEVVKANKEKAAAEKREKERQRAQQAAAAGVSGSSGVGGMHIGGGSDGDLAVVTAGGSRGHLDPPKDRNQLAVMRVIRRNLVYAVGLPPSIATEDILRKPEYHGQYGKISKIVLNRNHNGNGDPRRASASAYVTFAHKEDALACILALDGFYVDGRNIRASYGTSKYCSAFIKNVRCNNPDCTYLHCMGDSDDTFTKQEIQAGYVTSGRDVLARQQQLSAGTNSRRRIGSGGPSGTGKVANNPVFPPPTYEELSKPSQTNLVPPPPPATSSTTQFPPVGSASVQRSVTTTGIAGFSAVAAGNGPTPSLASVTKMSRSVSAPRSAIAHKPEPALTPAEMLSRQQEELRKKHPQNSTNTNKKKTSTESTTNFQSNNSTPSAPASTTTAAPAPPSTTAASIVAGVHTTLKPNAAPSRHTTLTALTPLKRASSLHEKKDPPKLGIAGNMTSSDMLPPNHVPLPKGLSSSQQAAFLEQRKEAFIATGLPRDTSTKLHTLRSNSMTLANDLNKTNAGSAIASLKAPTASGIGSIGGKVIGGSINAPIAVPIGSFGNQNSSIGIGSLGNLNSSGHGGLLGSIGPSSLGGVERSNVGGQAIGGFGAGASSGAIGGSSILSQPLLSNLGESKANGNGSSGLFGNSNFGSIGGTGLWDQLDQNNTPRYPSAPSQGNNNAIGGSLLGVSSNLGNPGLSGNNLSGSSALASMLGIQLPTGVGSLRETLWASSTPLKGPFSAVKTNTPTPIGAGIKKSSDGLIIGGHSGMRSAGGVPIGGYGSSIGPNSSGNKNDIALLQSLLPGVHISGGNPYQPAAPNNGGGGNLFGGSDWGGLDNSQPNHQSQKVVGGLSNQQYQQGDSWNNGYSAAPGPQKPDNARNHPNIW